MESNKKNLVVLVGGTSPEREVSQESSYSMYKALVSLGHNVSLVDPAYGENQPDNNEDFFGKNKYAPLSDKNYIEAFSLPLFNETDLVIIGLHGKHGEDGTIQSLLELRGIPYTGSGVLASALSMDKNMSKIMFRHCGVKTADWFTATKKDSEEAVIKKINDSFGFPCIVKPNDQGSTIGLTMVEKREDAGKAVEEALRYSSLALIEEYIPGKELGVGVVGDRVFPVLEIRPKHVLYDYECKYTDGMSEYIVPAEIDDKLAALVKEQALKAYKAVGTSGYGRVDFRLSADNAPLCLEVNTLPGMTSHSLLPKMAKAEGVSFEELMDIIVRTSLNE